MVYQRYRSVLQLSGSIYIYIYKKTGIPREICCYILNLMGLVENTEDSF